MSGWRTICSRCIEKFWRDKSTTVYQTDNAYVDNCIIHDWLIPSLFCDLRLPLSISWLMELLSCMSLPSKWEYVKYYPPGIHILVKISLISTWTFPFYYVICFQVFNDGKAQTPLINEQHPGCSCIRHDEETYLKPLLPHEAAVKVRFPWGYYGIRVIMLCPASVSLHHSGLSIFVLRGLLW